MKFKFTLLYLLSLCIFFPNQAFNQNKTKDIYIKKQKTDLKKLLNTTENNYDIRFFYYEDSIPNVNIIVQEDSLLLDFVLKDAFSESSIQITSDDYGNYFLFKNFKLEKELGVLFNETIQSNEQEENNTSDEYLKTYKNYISEHIVVGSNKDTKKNELVQFSGYVINESDGTTIPQARLMIKELNMNLTSDISGYFQTQLKPGKYTVTVNSLGMYEKIYKVTLLSKGTLNITLKTKSFLMDEAVVSANRNHNVRSTSMGFEKISTKAFKELPVVLGEKDIVKVALLLPGVQSVGEISSGFNVRGSPADQNMFYINNVPVYNSSHLFGLYTTFNGDAISEFDFYKSNIPIEYGGQLSSIFDIKAKKGNTEHFSARGGIGPFSSRALVEGPMLKDSSSSFLISIRSTYSDWILNQIDNIDIKNSSASFYDALTSFSLKLNNKNDIDLFFYGSNDKSDLAFGIKNKYQNVGGSLKWTHILSKKLIAEFNLVKTQYYYDLENYEIDYLGYKNSFELNHNEVKLNFKYFLNDWHDVLIGVNAKLYNLNNGDLLPRNEESSIKSIEFQSEKAVNASLYLSDKWEISNQLSFEAGIRATYYAYLGPQKVYHYQDDAPKDFNNIIDSTNFNNNNIISDNVNYDFRIAGKYAFTPNFSIKAGYNMLHQYIFMLSNTVSVSPTNKWKLSDSHLKPMSGEQYSVGLYNNLWKDKIETSVEVYYKDIKNQLEYKDGAEFLTNQLPETEIIQGDIKAYGIELMIKKKTGKINGWVNYTYSKAEVKALNPETGEMNNQGLAYPANYDKPHAVNLAINYKATKRITLSANMVYSTGRPITYPTSLYYQNNVQIIGFSKRNEYRLPDYFRTDFSINIEGNLKKNKLAHSTWSISFYNVTARKNPYSLVFQNEDGKIKGYQTSILGTIIPSISYNLKFGNYED